MNKRTDSQEVRTDHRQRRAMKPVATAVLMASLIASGACTPGQDGDSSSASDTITSVAPTTVETTTTTEAPKVAKGEFKAHVEAQLQQTADRVVGVIGEDVLLEPSASFPEIRDIAPAAAKRLGYDYGSVYDSGVGATSGEVSRLYTLSTAEGARVDISIYTKPDEVGGFDPSQARSISVGMTDEYGNSRTVGYGSDSKSVSFSNDDESAAGYVNRFTVMSVTDSDNIGSMIGHGVDFSTALNNTEYATITPEQYAAQSLAAADNVDSILKRIGA